jgi:hypothetical protein
MGGKQGKSAPTTDFAGAYAAPAPPRWQGHTHGRLRRSFKGKASQDSPDFPDPPDFPGFPDSPGFKYTGSAAAQPLTYLL